MLLPIINKLLKKLKNYVLHLRLRWGRQDIRQFAQVLREKKNNLSQEVIMLTPQQATGMLLTYYTNATHYYIYYQTF